MTALRSLLFILALWVWTLALGLAFLPALAAPRTAAVAAARFWLRGVFALLKTICGLTYRVEGAVPTGGALVAAKHQSTLETFAFRLILDDPAVILKKELLRIPIFGWYLAASGVIAIDRAAGTKALKAMVKGAEAAAADGRQVLIFPEGTRKAPGDAPDYHTGIAMIYGALELPCVPVALDSGVFWGRGSLSKKPGTVTIRFLDPIPPGMDRKAFMAELEARIEGATAELVARARA